VRVARFPMTAERAAGRSSPPERQDPDPDSSSSSDGETDDEDGATNRRRPTDADVASSASPDEGSRGVKRLRDSNGEVGGRCPGSEEAGSVVSEVEGSGEDVPSAAGGLEELEGGKSPGRSAAEIAADEARKAQRRR
jgi:hypothetical protein